MTKIEIDSVAKFISTIGEKIEGKEGYEFFFRGHASDKYKMFPAIYREGWYKYYKNEAKIYNEIISELPEEFKEENLTIEKLIKMQHFGFPTRLLDITKNPLVALFFSCKDNNKEEEAESGAIWMFSEKEKDIKFYDSDIVTILANLTKISSDSVFVFYDNSAVNDFNKLESVKKLIDYVREDKPNFETIIKPYDISKCVFLRPKYNTQRIIRQAGAFIIFGMAPENKQNRELLEKAYDFIIPNKYKKSILRELDILGINESTLFPDLENKGKYLKEKYFSTEDVLYFKNND